MFKLHLEINVEEKNSDKMQCLHETNLEEETPRCKVLPSSGHKQDE
jgi:hypothetical protein